MNSQPVLVMADWEPPGTFDPSHAATVTQLRADTLVFARLWLPDPAGHLVPDLAAAVPKASAGGLTLSLRRGLRWSDGQPLTAADVVFSCALECGGIAATALGPLEVRFGTRSPDALDRLFVVPQHRASAPGFFAAPNVASGPFRLRSATPDLLVFERNPLYHGRPAYLAELDWLLLPSHDATVFAAQAGEADLLPHLGPADAGASFGGLRTEVTISRRLEMLVPRGLDPRLVTALSVATDRSALVRQVFGRGRPAGARQLALARLLLAGTQPALTLTIPCADAIRAQEAQALAAQWAEIGVATTVTCHEGIDPAAQLSLYAQEAPPSRGAVPLLYWPAVRAVSPALHGFRPNDTVGTDFWNAADWWLGY